MLKYEAHTQTQKVHMYFDLVFMRIAVTETGKGQMISRTVNSITNDMWDCLHSVSMTLKLVISTFTAQYHWTTVWINGATVAFDDLTQVRGAADSLLVLSSAMDLIRISEAYSSLQTEHTSLQWHKFKRQLSSERVFS